MNQPTVEKRIAAALADNDIVSIELAALITETETAIVQAETTAKTEHARALDPALSPDLSKARAAKEDAEFAAAQLHTLLPRLQRRLQEVEAAEYAKQWDANYKKVEAQRDAAAKKFAKYPELVAELVDIFRDAEEADRDVSRINGSAPPGEHRRLRGVELTARSLECFSRDNPQITDSAQFPEWENSGRMAWPPPQVPLAVQFAMSMVPQYNPRYSADWAAALEADNVRRQQNEARWREEEAARQAASRQAYEASLRR